MTVKKAAAKRAKDRNKKVSSLVSRIAPKVHVLEIRPEMIRDFVREFLRPSDGAPPPERAIEGERGGNDTVVTVNHGMLAALTTTGHIGMQSYYRLRQMLEQITGENQEAENKRGAEWEQMVDHPTLHIKLQGLRAIENGIAEAVTCLQERLQ